MLHVCQCNICYHREFVWRLSIRVSQGDVILRRLNVEFSRISKTLPQNSPKTPVLWRKRSQQISEGINPIGAQNCVCWPVHKCSAQPYRRKFVSIQQWSASMMVRWQRKTWRHQRTTLVIVALWWSQLRFSLYQQGWLYESPLMTPTFTYVCDMKHRLLAVWYLSLLEQFIYKNLQI